MILLSFQFPVFSFQPQIIAPPPALAVKTEAALNE
jgi:hypothetical protein